MKFAIPAVDCESGFLWRHRARALNCGEVLRKDNPPFEFWCARVTALGTVDGGSVAPESAPMIGRSFERLRSAGNRLRNPLRRECDDKREPLLRSIWIEFKFVMIGFIEQRVAHPFNTDMIFVLIDFSMDPNS